MYLNITKKFGRNIRRRKRHKMSFLPLLIVPAAASIIIFSLYPMIVYLPAVLMDWRPPQPLSSADFVGLRWFKEILNYHDLDELIRNSVILGICDVLLLPIPLILALASQYCFSNRLKRMLDVFVIIPMFIPSVVVAGVTQKILSTEGLLNQFLALFGIAQQNHLLNGELFYVYFSLSGFWSGMGVPYMVYKACLSGSSRELHEAARIDGAGLLTRMLQIDLPLCKSTFLTNFALQMAGILSTNTERLLLYKNTVNSAFSTTLDLYAYELMFDASLMPAYSKSMAMGLMTTIVNVLLLLIARKATGRKENIYE